MIGDDFVGLSLRLRNLLKILKIIMQKISVIHITCRCLASASGCLASASGCLATASGRLATAEACLSYMFSRAYTNFYIYSSPSTEGRG